MTLRAGNTTGVCVLGIIDDVEMEFDETMTVAISNVTLVPAGVVGTAALGVNASTQITIKDNEGRYRIATSFSFT